MAAGKGRVVPTAIQPAPMTRRPARRPTAGNSTVNAGTNLTSYCTTLSGSSAGEVTRAGTSCQNSTTDACSYNTGNHTVSCPGRTAVARPTTGAWDAGAYQFAGAPASLSINTTSLPGGTVGTAYNQTLSASGGTLPYTWSLKTGTLPGGLALSAGGLVSGAPTSGGTANFTVQVKDNASPTANTRHADTFDRRDGARHDAAPACPRDSPAERRFTKSD